MLPSAPPWTAGCYFWATFHQAWHQLPMVECQAHTTIKGYSSRTRLNQYFTNVADKNIEQCKYAFPLYDGVSVVSFRCQVGDKVLEGVVKERAEAKLEFDAAVARGQSAGLMEQAFAASDVFSTSLGNVPSNVTVIVTIEYVTELQHDPETDGLKFEMPTGVAPRYGASSTGSMPAVSYPCPVNEVPPARAFEWTCDIEMPNVITKVDSPTHSVSITLGQISSQAEDSDPDFKKCSAKMILHRESGLSKELVLTVKAKGTKEPMALWETHPSISSHTALMATLVPNFALPQIKPEIVFVCDRSGSMNGEPIKTLIEALRVMLHSLPANGIKFNICSFGSQNSFLFETSQSYSRATLEEAIRHVDAFAANFGGTETQAAIRATIERRYGDIPLEVILLTDGDIWSQQSFFEYLNVKVAESKQQIRVFPLGIGHGVSTALIEGVARAGNGFPSTVMPGERMDQRCVRMLKAALSPHIADYRLEVVYERKEDDEDDFEMVESVEEATQLAIRPRSSGSAPAQAASEVTDANRKVISLFDTSVNADAAEVANSDASLPKLRVPRILQAPFNMPPLYAFKRATVYLLLGPDSACRKPKSVILKGTHEGSELSLEIPVLDIGESKTVHQLAARKATQDLEEGRGWLYAATNEDGQSIAEAHPSAWVDLIKNEAVRIGTTFQVMNRWCSFVARDTNIGDEHIATADGNTNQQQQQRQQRRHMVFLSATSDKKKRKSTRTNQTARVSQSGTAPRKQLASQAAVPQSMAVPASHTPSSGGLSNSQNTNLAGSALFAATPRSPNTAAPAGPVFKDNAAKVRALIGLQEFDGSWMTSGGDGKNLESFAWIMEVKESVLMAASSGNATMDEAVWSTLCVVVWLEEKMGEEREVFEMSVEKAETWLENSGLGIKDMQSLKEVAKRMLA